MTNPWAFGWTQLFTIVGFLITIAIAIGGFRSFARWKRERIEERRIDIAFDVLSVAHESKFVFGRIRDPNGFEGEWKNMPPKEGESEQDRNMRGGSYATLAGSYCQLGLAPAWALGARDCHLPQTWCLRSSAYVYPRPDDPICKDGIWSPTLRAIVSCCQWARVRGVGSSLARARFRLLPRLGRFPRA
jgi:hypothetical protein